MNPDAIAARSGGSAFQTLAHGAGHRVGQSRDQSASLPRRQGAGERAAEQLQVATMGLEAGEVVAHDHVVQVGGIRPCGRMCARNMSASRAKVRAVTRQTRVSGAAEPDTVVCEYTP
jgi:hypothetical protein